MEQCPHCGSPVDSPKCPNCGQSFEALPDTARAPPENGTGTPPATDEPDKLPDGESPDQPAVEEPTETDGVKISRRALLGGAGASVALLGAGGAGWWYLQGGGEGNQVVKSYVNAVAANDWTKIANLYHDDAPLMKRIEEDANFDSYERYLRERERLQRWERLEPTFRTTVEIFHVTDVTRESEEQLRLGVEGSAVEAIDEYRRVVAFASVSVDALREDQDDVAKYYDNGTENEVFPCTVVLANGSWQLWTGRLSPPV